MKIFLIWKTQVRPSTSGNRISFLGSSTDSHQITSTVKTVQSFVITLQIQKMHKGIEKKGKI
jgi:hypothetical protein